MTPDLQRLQQAGGTLEPIIERLELELVDDPTWPEPSDTSYLTEKDRADPDIAANVEAMAATNKLISWFGRDAEGFVGMWRGPGERAIHEAPIVRLDTEGQYSIVAATIPEYIAISVPEDEFASVRDALVSAGFTVGNNPDAIWGALDSFNDDPNAYRNELYEQNRAARGLVRTDDDDGGEAGQDDTTVEAAPSDSAAPMYVTDERSPRVEIEIDVADLDEEPPSSAADADGDDDDEPAPAPRAKAKAKPKAALKAKPKAKPAAKAKPKAKAKAKPAARKAKPAAKKPAAKKPAAKKPAAKQKPAKKR